jgi:hypothetical protein
MREGLHMKKVFIVLIISILVQPAFADFSTVKCLSAKETAEELLVMESSGRQVPESTCMTRENFPRYNVGPRVSSGGDQADTRKPVVLLGREPFVLHSVTKDENDNYLVKFEYKLEDGKTLSDQFKFVLYQKGELKKFLGCAAIVAEPKTLAIHAACLPTR